MEAFYWSVDEHACDTTQPTLHKQLHTERRPLRTLRPPLAAEAVLCWPLNSIKILFFNAVTAQGSHLLTSSYQLLDVHCWTYPKTSRAICRMCPASNLKIRVAASLTPTLSDNFAWWPLGAIQQKIHIFLGRLYDAHGRKSLSPILCWVRIHTSIPSSCLLLLA